MSETHALAMAMQTHGPGNVRLFEVSLPLFVSKPDE